MRGCCIQRRTRRGGFHGRCAATTMRRDNRHGQLRGFHADPAPRSAHAAVRGPTHFRVATTENPMDLQLLIAQWSGALPPGFVHPAVRREDPPRCSQPRCSKPASRKPGGGFWKSCDGRTRRAQSCRRCRAALVAEGGCRRCSYRKRLEGDFLCARCRVDRDVERARRRQDALDAAAIDEFAARPDGAHRASNLDVGLSPWNARPRREPSAAYWSPLPDPEPRSEQIWRWSPMNGRLHRR